MVQDYVDITPSAINTEGMTKRRTVFQETEWAQINKNPAGLTREGVLKRIELWKQSNNRHVETKYKTMLMQCKQIRDSGQTNDGKTIFARRSDGSAYWIDE